MKIRFYSKETFSELFSELFEILLFFSILSGAHPDPVSDSYNFSEMQTAKLQLYPTWSYSNFISKPISVCHKFLNESQLRKIKTLVMKPKKKDIKIISDL